MSKSMDNELERLRSENERLREENRWLYAEIGGEKAAQAISEWRALKARVAELEGR